MNESIRNLPSDKDKEAIKAAEFVPLTLETGLLLDLSDDAFPALVYGVTGC
jgi:hypothetical protein